MLELAELAAPPHTEMAQAQVLVVALEDILVLVVMGQILTSRRVMPVLAVVVAPAQATGLLLVLTSILVLAAAVELGY
jgi:hypothetical protein